MILLNKVAGVTSPSPGIRAATALEFAKEGQNVVAVGTTNVEGANDIVRNIEEMGGHHKTVRCLRLQVWSTSS